MAVQFKALYKNAHLERGYDLQKVCLGGKIITPEYVTQRMDTADECMTITCLKCKIACLENQCPVKYAHREVLRILFKVDELFQSIEEKLFDKEKEFIQRIPDDYTDEERQALIDRWWFNTYNLLDLFPYVDAKEETLEYLTGLYQEGIDRANDKNAKFMALIK